MSGRFKCSECAAEFASESEVLRHVSEPHRRAESGRAERMATPSYGSTTPPHGDKLAPRKNREFSRRNPE
jgi:hypothetical protein